jgi:hypothetical protein
VWLKLAHNIGHIPNRNGTYVPKKHFGVVEMTSTCLIIEHLLKCVEINTALMADYDAYFINRLLTEH